MGVVGPLVFEGFKVFGKVFEGWDVGLWVVWSKYVGCTTGT